MLEKLLSFVKEQYGKGGKVKEREARDPNLGPVGSVEARTSRETAHRRVKVRGMEEQDR